jgi:dipeptidyl aminopeptidase/acylaminoacyl peptidase
MIAIAWVLAAEPDVARLRDPAVITWRDERTVEALGWLDEELLAWVRRRSAELTVVQDAQKVEDHRAGVTVAVELSIDPNAAHDATNERILVTWPGEPPTEVGGPPSEHREQSVCAASLSPSGEHLVWGRARDLKCELHLTVPEGPTTPLGAYRLPQVVLAADGTVWLTHRNWKQREAWLNRPDAVFTRPVVSRHALEPLFTSVGAPWLLASSRDDRRRWVVDVEHGPWTRLPNEDYRWAGVHERGLWALVGEGEQTRRVAIDLSDPRRSAWVEHPLPDPPSSIRAAWRGPNAWWWLVERDGLQWLRRQADGEPPVDALDRGFVSAAWVRPLASNPVLIARGEGDLPQTWITAPNGLIPPVSESVAQRTVFATSADGTQVPLTVARRESASDDAPVWMRVYGGFGVVHQNEIGAAERVWLELGGVLATVHARGGGERGSAWHEAARREHKERTFDDVIAAAEWFRAQGSNRVAVTGGSNGGLSAMASVARRPDLFAAAAGAAGVYDMVRGPKLGMWWPREYGTPRWPAARDRLTRISPVHTSPPGPLPPIWLATGQTDPVVPPAHSHLLRAAWEGLPGGPILLRTVERASHEKVPRSERWRRGRIRDDQMELVAFLIQALSVPWPGE